MAYIVSGGRQGHAMYLQRRVLRQVGRNVPIDQQRNRPVVRREEWRTCPKDGTTLQQMTEILAGYQGSKGVGDGVEKAAVWDGVEQLLKLSLRARYS